MLLSEQMLISLLIHFFYSTLLSGPSTIITGIFRLPSIILLNCIITFTNIKLLGGFID